MKKVKFIKDHVNGIKKGQSGDFSDGRANYLVRIGVAEYVEDKESKQEPKKAVVKPKAKPKQSVVKEEPCKTC